MGRSLSHTHTPSLPPCQIAAKCLFCLGKTDDYVSGCSGRPSGGHGWQCSLKRPLCRKQSRHLVQIGEPQRELPMKQILSGAPAASEAPEKACPLPPTTPTSTPALHSSMDTHSQCRAACQVGPMEQQLQPTLEPSSSPDPCCFSCSRHWGSLTAGTEV